MHIDPLGDGISSVELIDHMGDDLRVVNAARVSLSKMSDWEFEEIFVDSILTRKQVLRLSDAKLIRFLSSHNHWTPFGHPQFCFRIKMPIFVIREWYRHEVGLVRNEVSRRYVTEEPEFFVPSVWRKKPEGNIKQGSGSEFGPAINEVLTNTIDKYVKGATYNYDYMIGLGVAPEMARMGLPQNMYTEFIETGSLAAYGRIGKLRLAPDAMGEIRKYAEAVASLIEPIVPVSWDALMNHDPMSVMRRKYEEEIKELNYRNKELEKEVNDIRWKLPPLI